MRELLEIVQLVNWTNFGENSTKIIILFAQFINYRPTEFRELTNA